MEIGEPWKPRGQRLPTLLLNIALSGMSHLRVFSAMVSTGITYRKSGSNPSHSPLTPRVKLCLGLAFGYVEVQLFRSFS